MTEGRATVLAAIRRGLRRGALPADQAASLRARLASPPRQLQPARTRLPRAGLIALFAHNVEAVFGTVAHAASTEEIPGLVASYLAAQNLAPEAVVAPHPELRTIPWAKHPLLALREGAARDADTVAVQHAFAGIAETGTLMLPSAPERPTTLNLLPETEIAVLRASRVVGAYEDAFDLLKQAGTTPALPRNVMLVTGPSRSADIEQTLELGAHGPRRLHVIVLDDLDAPAAA